MNELSASGKVGAWNRRSWASRASLLAATVAAGASLLAGCGGSSTGGTAAKNYSNSSGKKLAYAECMRSHGEPDWPDPGSNGEFNLPPSIIPSSALDRATTHCNRLDPIKVISPAQIQKGTRVYLKFSECMRAHGVTRYPDPDSIGGLPASPPGVDVNSPSYQAAFKACNNALRRQS